MGSIDRAITALKGFDKDSDFDIPPGYVFISLYDGPTLEFPFGLPAVMKGVTGRTDPDSTMDATVREDILELISEDYPSVVLNVQLENGFGFQVLGNDLGMFVFQPSDSPNYAYFKTSSRNFTVTIDQRDTKKFPAIQPLSPAFLRARETFGRSVESAPMYAHLGDQPEMFAASMAGGFLSGLGGAFSGMAEREFAEKMQQAGFMNANQMMDKQLKNQMEMAKMANANQLNIANKANQTKIGLARFQQQTSDKLLAARSPTANFSGMSIAGGSSYGGESTA